MMTIEQSQNEYTLGIEESSRGNYLLALDHFLTSERLIHHHMTCMRIAITLERLGRTAEAFTYSEMAYHAKPEHSQTAMLYAEMLVRVGNATQAVGVLEDILRRNTSYNPAKKLLVVLQGAYQENEQLAEVDWLSRLARALPVMLILTPFTVEGAWQLREGQTRKWEGTIQGERDFVALPLLQQPDQLIWCKSEQSQNGVMSLHLQLDLCNTGDLLVQMRVGSSWNYFVAATLMSERTGTPEIQVPITLRTGKVERLTTIPGDLPLTVALCLFDRRDVTFVRKRIWRLRPYLTTGMTEPFTNLFLYGRTGVLQG